jgi:hypothetical protein
MKTTSARSRRARFEEGGAGAIGLDPDHPVLRGVIQFGEAVLLQRGQDAMRRGRGNPEAERQIRQRGAFLPRQRMKHTQRTIQGLHRLRARVGEGRFRAATRFAFGLGHAMVLRERAAPQHRSFLEIFFNRGMKRFFKNENIT